MLSKKPQTIKGFLSYYLKTTIEVWYCYIKLYKVKNTSKLSTSISSDLMSVSYQSDLQNGSVSLIFKDVWVDSQAQKPLLRATGYLPVMTIYSNDSM